MQCAGSTACVDIATDPANCGSCGNACLEAQVCSNGMCSAECGAGQTACSGACVDLSSNVDHCGACETACSAAKNETCSDGMCECEGGLASCADGCADLQTDASNCGMCGNACGTGQTCSGGSCACGAGQTSCSDTCVNLMTDAKNCGECGKACAEGQECSDGSCSGGTSPCDVLEAAGNSCVSAHSTVRRLVSAYAGPLYQVCKGSHGPGPSSCKSGMTMDIGLAADGFADAAAQQSFCAGGDCTISKIYDQSGQGNDLEPAPRGGAKPSPDDPADASALPVTIDGHSVYGILIKAGIGYRTGCSGCNIKTGHGTATGDQPQTMYWVTSQRDLIDGCCFDYGNAETTSNDDGNGTMETLYFGGGVVWGTGAGGKPGPWMMADLENGLYAGWENNQDRNISTNTPLKYDFVTGVVVGDTADKNGGKGRFAIYGGDATNGALKTLYDGIRPNKPGYVPMQKQGSIILGIGGDNSNSAGGRFYEGVVANGAATKETIDALQAAIVEAGYGRN